MHHKKLRHGELLFSGYEVVISPEARELLNLCNAVGHGPGHLGERWTQPAIELYRANNVVLRGENGAAYSAMTARNVTVIDESFTTDRRLKASVLPRMTRLPTITGKSGLTLSLVNKPARRNLYHWVYETLPRAYALTCVDEPVRVAVFPAGEDFHRATLDLISERFPCASVETIQPGEWWRAEQLLIMAMGLREKVGFWHRDLARFVRQLVLEGFGLAGTTTDRRRIYLSRAGASKRRVLNEAELHGVLRAFGFEIVVAERLSYRDQVALFRSASHIVAPHGAGLTNMVFAENAAVMVLHSRELMMSHYHLMALSLGHRTEGWAWPDENALGDYRVPPDELEQRLNVFLIPS